MSRSYKKNPVFSWTSSNSEKWEKVTLHRRLRRIQNELVSKCVDWDALLLPTSREVSSIWYWSKDGKWHCYRRYFPEGYLKYLRK